MLRNDIKNIEGKYELTGGIVRISFKSSLIIMFVITIFSIIIPYFVWLKNIDYRPVIIVGNSIFTSLTVAYSRCFIDTKRGFCKSFFGTALFFSMGIWLLGYCWLYLNLYM